MDKEFHYYMTYLIAGKAGYNVQDAHTIAYASQYTDDNDCVFCVGAGTEYEYRNYISQTMNILKPKHDLLRIYSLFHFIPGVYESESAQRKDGKLHRLNTTPDSPNANKIIDKAISTGSLYRIGIACHAYADTFAHQNFVGYFDAFNGMKGMLEKALPEVGHAEAKHDPDIPGLIWSDDRLISKYALVVNCERIVQAAVKIFHKLAKSKTPGITDTELDAKAVQLKADLEYAIGEPREGDDMEKDNRINRYQELCQRPEYGGESLKDFDEHEWFSEAVDGPFEGLKIVLNEAINHLTAVELNFNWRDSANRGETRWYKFQEAVKAHQNDAWDILSDDVFSRLELEKL